MWSGNLRAGERDVLTGLDALECVMYVCAREMYMDGCKCIIADLVESRENPQLRSVTMEILGNLTSYFI